MTGNEVMIITGLTQGALTNDETLFEKIEDWVNLAVKEKDVEIALLVCKQLHTIGKKSGLALAKALYLIKKNWDVFEMDEDFEDIVYAEVGLNKYTVERYVAVFAMHDQKLIPEEFTNEIKNLNIKEQIPIAKALDQGYVIEKDNWNKLATAGTFSEIGQIIREDVKGKPSKKGGLTLHLDNAGTITAYQDNEKFFVGSLEVDDEQQPVQKAINRIVNQAGIIRK